MKIGPELGLLIMPECNIKDYAGVIDDKPGRLERWWAKETHHIVRKSESFLWNTQHIAVEDIILVAVVKNGNGVGTRSHSLNNCLNLVASRLQPDNAKGLLKK